MKKCIFLVALLSSVAFWTPHDVSAGEQKLTFSGDLRGRLEGFWYQADETGDRSEDRRRLRYRLRLDAKAKLSDYTAVALRFGSNGFDNRSGNQTLGSPADWGPNEFGIRRAYLIYMPFKGGKLPNREGHWDINFGKVPIPFAWKNGKDIMLWDNDLNPSGGSTTFEMSVAENAAIFANVGAFIIEELKAKREPFVSGLQGGVLAEASDHLKFGLRGSFYYFDYLDRGFIERAMDGTGGSTSGGGNIEDGLTGDPNGGSMSVVATHGFMKASRFPVLVFGGYSTNLSAEASRLYDVDKENIAYNAGAEFGDKKKYVKLGAAYYHIEANAFPSQFIDSDLLDGRTNRKGFLFYASRQLIESCDLDLKVFNSDAIEAALPDFEESVKNSERTRLQFDVIYKF